MSRALQSSPKGMDFMISYVLLLVSAALLGLNTVLLALATVLGGANLFHSAANSDLVLVSAASLVAMFSFMRIDSKNPPARRSRKILLAAGAVGLFDIALLILHEHLYY